VRSNCSTGTTVGLAHDRPVRQLRLRRLSRELLLLPPTNPATPARWKPGGMTYIVQGIIRYVGGRLIYDLLRRRRSARRPAANRDFRSRP
jgi:hypothetical protein